MQPIANNNRISVAFIDSLATNGFIWERSETIMRFCPENGDSIYDHTSGLCRGITIE